MGAQPLRYAHSKQNITSPAAKRTTPAGKRTTSPAGGRMRAANPKRTTGVPGEVVIPGAEEQGAGIPPIATNRKDPLRAPPSWQ